MKKAIKIAAAAITAAAVFAVGYGIGYAVNEKSQIKTLSEMPLKLPDGFTVTAHTGCENTKMNSLEAIKAGIEAGANTVEFDLNFKSDGSPVLSHDKVKDSQKCVTLDEAFELISSYEGVTVNVDIKATDNLSVIEKSAEKYNMLDRIFYTGVGKDFLPAVKKDSPNVKYFLNVDFDSSKKFNSEYISEFVKLVKESGAVGINLNYNCLSAETVRQFHDNNLLVSTFTVDDYKDMYKVLLLAPDNITTKNPSKIIEIIGK